MLLYDDSKFDSNKNTRLLNAAIKDIVDSAGRFTVPLVLYYRNEFILFSYFVLFSFIYFFQNMTELFITLFCPVFIYLYLTQIQYNLCLILIERADTRLMNDFSFKHLFSFLFVIVIALAFFWLKVRVLVSCFCTVLDL